MHLMGPQLRKLREALIRAFPNSDEFDQLLNDHLNQSPEQFTEPGPLDRMYRTLIDLVEAARAEQPRNTELRQVAEKLGLEPELPQGEALQRIVDESNPVVDAQIWLDRATENISRVCRIVIDDGATAKPIGTGFLVGPSAVMTNYHVVAGAINGTLNPATLRAQFDYRRLSDGSHHAGTFVRFASEWLIDFAPASAIDKTAHPIAQEVGPEELDYAVLKLDRPFGNEPVKLGPKRGWIDLQEPAQKAKKDGAVYIVQHPNGATMKIAPSPQPVIGYSPAERRVRYRANTFSGSSGSPAFDGNWRILALHHSGDPDLMAVAEYNEGIPITAITQLLAQRGKLATITGVAAVAAPVPRNSNFCYIESQPFVDRNLLREKLDALSDPETGKRILVVTGDRYSGNSHARDHIARRGHEFVDIRLAEYAGHGCEEMAPIDLGEAIAKRMNLPDPDLKDDRTARWSVNFMHWLASVLDPNRQWWIVIDDFENDGVDVPLPVYEFIELLCNRMGSDPLAKLRLVLISYRRELPQDAKQWAEREVVPEIRDDDLFEYFLTFFHRFLPSRDPEKSYDEVIALVRRVRDRMRPGKTALHDMRCAIRQECTALLPRRSGT